MSIVQYSPDGKFEAGSYMDGMWSGPQGTDPRGGLFNQPSNPSNPQNYQGFNQTLGQPNAPQVGQGLMGLAQQPQGDSFMGGNPFNASGYAGVKPAGMGGFYAEETGFTPPQGYNQLGEFIGQQPQGNMPPMPQGNMPQAKPMQSFFEGPTKGQIPNGFSMINGELVNLRGVPQSNNLTPALNPTPPPPQIFQPQPMQQQPSNPVNTQSVQPNFMGQAPFGQPQTSQYSSSNPFVQAAQANAQGNLAGALQATAANRVNQQTPFGGLQYQQTGTDAQGNPIWSANQTVAQPYQNAINSLSGQIQQNFAQPFDTSQYQNQMVGSTPQFQGVGQAPNLQTSVQGTGMQGWDQATNLLMSRLNPQIKQQNEASDAQLANQGIMPGSEAYNRAKTQIAQQQNDLLNQAQLAGSQIQNQMFNQNLAAGTFGNTALGNQNTMNLGNTAFNNALGQQGFANQLSGTAANNAARQANFGQGLTQYQLPTASLGSLRAATTPGYVNPYNQAAVAGPDYLSAYTSQNATDIARQNAEAAQRSSLLNTLGGLGSSAILGGTGANSALGGLLGLGSKGLESLGNSSLWNSLFGTGPAITGDKSYLDSIGLGGSTYGSGIGGMTTDPLADLYTNGLSPEQNLSDLFNSSFGFGY